MRAWSSSQGFSNLSKSSTLFSVRKSRFSSTFAALEAELKSRQLPILFDAPTRFPSHLLDATLEDFLPSSVISSFPQTYSGFGALPPTLPALRPGHHLLYFHSPNPLSALLPDGTDPEQSPGAPYVRRMWAGGRLKLLSRSDFALRLAGQPARCVERISDVVVKGAPGEEKIFVTIERRFTGTKPESARNGNVKWIDPTSALYPHDLRRHMEDDSNCSIIEYRNLVFLKERSESDKTTPTIAPRKILKPQHEPTISHTLVPTQDLLFRFSALTFNAHRIHLDKKYCQEVEGHRNLLVHGPLSLVLMLELLGRHIAKKAVYTKHKNPYLGGYIFPRWEIHEVEYRNLTPLYAEEPMKVCARAKDNDEWDIWIENSDGGYAVKGVAKTKYLEPRAKREKVAPSGLSDKENAFRLYST